MESYCWYLEKITEPLLIEYYIIHSQKTSLNILQMSKLNVYTY